MTRGTTATLALLVDLDLRGSDALELCIQDCRRKRLCFDRSRLTQQESLSLHPGPARIKLRARFGQEVLAFCTVETMIHNTLGEEEI